MLTLIRTSESIRIVFTDDPSVKAKKATDVPTWVSVRDAKVGNDATVVTARALSSSEMLVAQASAAKSDSSPEMEMTLRAAHVGVVRIESPGVDVSETDDIFEILEKFPPAALASLGSWVLVQSMLPPDPIEAVESE